MEVQLLEAVDRCRLIYEADSSSRVLLRDIRQKIGNDEAFISRYPEEAKTILSFKHSLKRTRLSF